MTEQHFDFTLPSGGRAQIIVPEALTERDLGVLCDLIAVLGRAAGLEEKPKQERRPAEAESNPGLRVAQQKLESAWRKRQQERPQAVDGIKECMNCHQAKPLSEFPVNNRATDGHIKTCREYHYAHMSGVMRRALAKEPETAAKEEDSRAG